MYARSYYPERDPETGIPKNYGGTALREGQKAEVPTIQPAIPAQPSPPPPPPCEETTEDADVATSAHAECAPNKNPWELPPPKKPRGGILDALFGTLPLGGLPDFFSSVGQWFSGGEKETARAGFSVEDLLILGVAAILFFSKSGDKECALMLLFLLVIR